MEERGADPLPRRRTDPPANWHLDEPQQVYRPPLEPYAPSKRAGRGFGWPTLAATLLAGLVAGGAVGWMIGHSGSADSTAAPAAKAAAISNGPATITLSGSMTLQGAGASFIWQGGGSTACTGYKGYDDITQGAPVTITNQAGTVIGTTHLGTGNVTSVTDGRADGCQFSFSAQVPGAPFYKVEVSHRGAISYSQQDARSGLIHMTLGN